jgi:hypothetical protein
LAAPGASGQFRLVVRRCGCRAGGGSAGPGFGDRDTSWPRVLRLCCSTCQDVASWPPFSGGWRGRQRRSPAVR